MMTSKKTGYLIGVILLLGIVAGCLAKEAAGLREPAARKQLFAMDTYMTFYARGEKAEEAVEAAALEIQRLDELLSAETPSSEVYQINEQGGGTVTEEVGTLLQRGLEIFESTGGIFDVTIYPLMELWGFPTKEYHVPSEEKLRETLVTVGSEKLLFDGKVLKLSDGQKIDFGGIGKGYASDCVMEIFRSHGIENGMISLGGNVYTLGTNESGQPWNIGIRDPKGGAQDAVATLRVSEKAVVTSGGYERFFEEDGHTYIHILNPKTGYPAEEDLVSVTIVSEDGTLADAMSTSIYLMGLENGADYWREHRENFDMILITEDDSIYVTAGIEGDFTCYEKYEVIR